jgi:hypothetical protein
VLAGALIALLTVRQLASASNATPPSEGAGSRAEWAPPLRQLDVQRFGPVPATPEPSAERGAVAVMTTNTTQDLADLEKALRYLGRAMAANMGGTPLLIIHEDLSPSQMARVHAAAAGASIADIRFVRVAFQLPPVVRWASACVPDAGKWVRHWTGNMRASLPGWRTHRHGPKPYSKRGGTHPYGYFHMCRFWAGAGFELPALAQFDYVMRIDTDSACTQQLPDVFATMRRKGAVYAYAKDAADGGDVVEGLYLAARSYAATAGAEAEAALERAMQHPRASRRPNCSSAPPGALALAPPFHDSSPPRAPDGDLIRVRPCEDDEFTALPTFYTNFEVVAMRFVRSSSYRAWFAHVDALGGIYVHRWGDAPIRWLGVRMHATAPGAVWRMAQPYCRHP